MLANIAWNGPLCLAVQHYAEENTCTQDNIKCAQNTKISISLAVSSQVFLMSLNVTGNVGKGTVILGSRTASTPQSWRGDLVSPLGHNPDILKAIVSAKELCRALSAQVTCIHRLL